MLLNVIFMINLSSKSFRAYECLPCTCIPPTDFLLCPFSETDINPMAGMPNHVRRIFQGPGFQKISPPPHRYSWPGSQTHQRVRLQLAQVRHAPLAPGRRQAPVEKVELVRRTERLRNRAGGCLLERKQRWWRSRGKEMDREREKWSAQAICISFSMGLWLET